MKIAIVCSNYFNIRKETANGTAIFDYSLITNLAERAQSENLFITAFASGESVLPVPVESIDFHPSSADERLIASGKNILYEQTLLSKAFSMQETFDVYHINIGDGDIALPFARFLKKPIIITLHHIRDEEYMRKYFSFYTEQANIFFVSANNAQRKLFPDLPYAATVHHGIDAELFSFEAEGGSALMWAGRAIPEKGMDLVVDVARSTGHDAKLFGIPRGEHLDWLQENVLDVIGRTESPRISYDAGRNRYELIEHFQTSKAFMLPALYEESFGLVLIEAMSCGTPVIAFAKGSIPEVIADGETGFIVNASNADIRGDWITKKTGVEGLREAVERLYAMSDKEYRAMRIACRNRILRHFTIDRMVDDYLNVYRQVIEQTSQD